MINDSERKITKEEALAFKKRWEEVNAFELEELKNTPPSRKVKQLATLMRWVKDFGWQNALKEGEDVVRERWIKLNRIYHGRK